MGHHAGSVGAGKRTVPKPAPRPETAQCQIRSRPHAGCVRNAVCGNDAPRPAALVERRHALWLVADLSFQPSGGGAVGVTPNRFVIGREIANLLPRRAGQNVSAVLGVPVAAEPKVRFSGMLQANQLRSFS
jgi:hypothetical protein